MRSVHKNRNVEKYLLNYRDSLIIKKIVRQLQGVENLLRS